MSVLTAGPGDRELANRSRPALLSPALILVFLASLGGDVSFYLLLTTVPSYASFLGADGVGAGLATGVLMISSVVAELATPWIVTRSGYRATFAGGLFLLGAPALVLAGTSDLAVVLAVSLVRGLGFGVTVVAGGALAASLVPSERRGEGLGLYGLVVGIPAIVALPLGAWLVAQFGYAPVFIAGAASALVVIVTALGLPASDRASEAASDPPLGVLAALRRPELARLAVVFVGTTAAAGVVVTFLPLAVRAADDLVAVALFVQALAATFARWAAGRYGDRHGSRRLLGPGLAIAAIGVFCLVLVGSPVAVVGGATLFGVGFGVSQNATLALMFERVPRAGYGAASAVWSIAYDAGMGAGAAAFGLIAAEAGYPSAFALTGLVMLSALAPLWRERHHVSATTATTATTALTAVATRAAGPACLAG